MNLLSSDIQRGAIWDHMPVGRHSSIVDPTSLWPVSHSYSTVVPDLKSPVAPIPRNHVPCSIGAGSEQRDTETGTNLIIYMR